MKFYFIAYFFAKNPALLAIQNILDSYGTGCGLERYASSPVFVCLSDTVVVYGSPLGSGFALMQTMPQSAPDKEANLLELRAQDETVKDQDFKGGQMQMMMSSPPPPQSEFSALYAFYDATYGESWTSTVNGTMNGEDPWVFTDPSTPVDVSNWYGITVNSSGNVIRIELPDNGLGGYIPIEIGSFPYLEVLSLERNHIGGNMPYSQGFFSNLNSLNIAENNMSGVLPSGLSNVDLSYMGIYGNDFYGSIPFNPSGAGSYLVASQNKFTFTNLLPHKDYYFNGDSYKIQDSVDVVKTFNLDAGDPFTLEATVDRSTSPASEYQWFKDGQPVNTRSVNGHTYAVPSVSGSDAGTYYYKIWNSDLSQLTLVSKLQSVSVEGGGTGVPSGYYSYCLEYGYAENTDSPFYLAYSYANYLAKCEADDQAKKADLLALAKKKLENQWLDTFYQTLELSCLENVTEGFTFTYTPREYHYTLYYYDQSGQLVKTVPPKGVHPLAAEQVDRVINQGTEVNPAHTLPSYYRYDSRNQLRIQESPDGGESDFWYDRAGQLRLSQNAVQSAADAYSYTRYDHLGRVVETGEMESTESRSQLLENLEDPSFPDHQTYTCYDITLTTYDQPIAGKYPGFEQEYLRTRVSWTAMVEKDRTDTVFTVYSYDAHGNVKALLQDLPEIGTKRTDYIYDLISGNVNAVIYQRGHEDQLIHRYRYDADNRIEEVMSSTDGFVWNTDATYFYYPHGPLARVELGEYNVQGLDYYYTLQGWLKGVNTPYTGDPGGDGENGLRTGGDAMAFSLGYYQDDYTPIGSGITLSDTRDNLWTRYQEDRGTTEAKGLYNGNISWMSTDLPSLAESDRMQAMVYGYDQLHRIVRARSLTEYNNSTYNGRGTGSKPYDVDYSYDPNGNLLTLQRLDENTSPQDDLTYSYFEESNKLKNVDGSDVENYSYDQIGNLISDDAEGIDSIAWTPYGKVRAVFKDDNSEVHFRYDASGNRIAKITDTDTTTYVRDATGNVMAVYKSDSLTEQAIYGSSRLGLINYASKTGYRTLGGKKYELSNHLGNVLAVVSDNIHLDQDSTWTTAINTTDYYPFGLAMDGRTVQDSTYRYGFQGQERDDEIKGEGRSINFKYRMHDPRLGRFLSIDPLTRNYPMSTPYSFAQNRVIDGIDLEGAEYVPAQIAEFGYYLEQKSKNSIEVLQDLSENTVGVSMGIGKGLLNVLKSLGPQGETLNQNDQGQLVRGSDGTIVGEDAFRDIAGIQNPIKTLEGIKETFRSGSLEDQSQVATEIGITLFTLGKSVKGKFRVPASKTHSPSFIVDPSGQAFPVPKGAIGPTPVVNQSGKQTGVAFTGGEGGANGKVNTIRIMDPTPSRGKAPAYENGYIKYENSATPKPQGVNPYSGKTGSNKETHFEIKNE